MKKDGKVGQWRTQSLIGIGSGRINGVRYGCFVTLDGNMVLARATFVVVVHGVSLGDVATSHIVLLLVLVVC